MITAAGVTLLIAAVIVFALSTGSAHAQTPSTIHDLTVAHFALKGIYALFGAGVAFILLWFYEAVGAKFVAPRLRDADRAVDRMGKSKTGALDQPTADLAKGILLATTGRFLGIVFMATAFGLYL